MTPTSLSTDAKLVDQRGRSARDAALDDQASSRDQRFNGVLSTLASEKAMPIASADPLGGTSSADEKASVLSALAHARGTSASAPSGSPIAFIIGSPSVEPGTDLIELVGAIAGGKTAMEATAASKDKTGASKAADVGVSAPDALAAGAAIAAPTSLNLMSMFGVSLQASAATPTSWTITRKAATIALATGSDLSLASAARSDGSIEPGPAVTQATDIASVSHLAPAQVFAVGFPLAVADANAGSIGAGKVLTGSKGDPTKKSETKSASITSGSVDQASAEVAQTAVSSERSRGGDASPRSSDPAIVASEITAPHVDESDATPTVQAGEGAMQASIQAIVNAASQLALAQTEAPASPSAALAARTNVASDSGAPVAPARTMTLELEPTALGAINVRLHLIGASLDVSLSVSDPKTLGLLTRERSSLSDALGGQNYQLNALVIQGTDGPAASTAGEKNANQGDTGRNGGSNQDQGGARDEQAASRQPNHNPAARDARSSSAASDSQLFV